MNLHLVRDEKFINQSVATFERYYPAQNWWLVQHNWPPKPFHYVKEQSHVQGHGFSGKQEQDAVIALAREKGVKRVLVHFLNPARARLALRLKQELGVKLYWIFYGHDLYDPLNKMGRYPLFDPGPVVPSRLLKQITTRTRLILEAALNGEGPFAYLRNFAAALDYFCFWNYYDFQLLQQHIKTSAVNKEFRYFSTNHADEFADFDLHDASAPIEIIVNNSASFNGNHLTLLGKLRDLPGIEAVKAIHVPLSYGPGANRKQIIQAGEKWLPGQFHPITSFMPKMEYLRFLNAISVGIYGSRRQEAGGNISYLLGHGAKVFVRKANNILRYYQDHGYHIFCVEDDLNSLADLQPMTAAQQQHNIQLYQAQFSQAEIDRVMQALLLE